MTENYPNNITNNFYNAFIKKLDNFDERAYPAAKSLVMFLEKNILKFSADYEKYLKFLKQKNKSETFIQNTIFSLESMPRLACNFTRLVKLLTCFIKTIECCDKCACFIHKSIKYPNLSCYKGCVHKSNCKYTGKRRSKGNKQFREITTTQGLTTEIENLKKEFKNKEMKNIEKELIRLTVNFIDEQKETNKYFKTHKSIKWNIKKKKSGIIYKWIYQKKIVYVGQTIEALEDRWKGHLNCSTTTIASIFAKDKRELIEMVVIEQNKFSSDTDRQKWLDLKELEYILKLDTHHRFNPEGKNSKFPNYSKENVKNLPKELQEKYKQITLKSKSTIKKTSQIDSGMLLFARENKSEIKETYPDLDSVNRLGILINRYYELSDKEQAEWKERAEADQKAIREEQELKKTRDLKMARELKDQLKNMGINF